MAKTIDHLTEYIKALDDVQEIAKGKEFQYQAIDNLAGMHKGLGNYSRAKDLLEYAFGMDPLSADGQREDGDGPGDPGMMIVSSGGETYPAVRFYRRVHQDADVEYSVEWNDGLAGAWTSGGIEHDVEVIDDQWERVVVRDTQKVAGTRFFRVRVEGVE